MLLEDALKNNPYIAILRGLTPLEAKSIGQCIYQSGIRVIEVPLNRPDAMQSIIELKKSLPDDCLIGAGTVTSSFQVKQLAICGVNFVISPHAGLEIIKTTLDNKMISIPGIATLTEAFFAYNCGATWLKLFPASTYGAAHLTAIKTVLPDNLGLIAVGGINASNAAQWLRAGALGLGIGSDLYRQGDSLTKVKENLRVLTKALDQYRTEQQSELSKAIN